MSEGSAMSPLSINEGHERRAGNGDIGQFHATLQPTSTCGRFLAMSVYLIYCSSNSRMTNVFYKSKLL